MVFTLSGNPNMNRQTLLSQLSEKGVRPFVASTGHLLPSLDLSVLGNAPAVKLLERDNDRTFHEAYLLANALGFGEAELKMPNWVLVDCVLMQSAVVGLMMDKDACPAPLLDAFARDATIDLDALDALPISGQVAGLGLDRRSWVGFSLFSLRRFVPDLPALGLITKALALETYQAQGDRFVGISHYDNKALSMHGRFGKKMWIEQAVIPLHPRRDMALVYAMDVDFTWADLDAKLADEPFDFLMPADDADAKQRLRENIAAGQRVVIARPFQTTTENGLSLPIRMENNK